MITHRKSDRGVFDQTLECSDLTDSHIEFLLNNQYRNLDLLKKYERLKMIDVNQPLTNAHRHTPITLADYPRTSSRILVQ